MTCLLTCISFCPSNLVSWRLMSFLRLCFVMAGSGRILLGVSCACRNKHLVYHSTIFNKDNYRYWEFLLRPMSSLLTKHYSLYLNSCTLYINHKASKLELELLNQSWGTRLNIYTQCLPYSILIIICINNMQFFNIL